MNWQDSFADVFQEAASWLQFFTGSKVADPEDVDSLGCLLFALQQQPQLFGAGGICPVEEASWLHPISAAVPAEAYASDPELEARTVGGVRGIGLGTNIAKS